MADRPAVGAGALGSSISPSESLGRRLDVAVIVGTTPRVAGYLCVLDRMVAPGFGRRSQGYRKDRRSGQDDLRVHVCLVVRPELFDRILRSDCGDAIVGADDDS